MSAKHFLRCLGQPALLSPSGEPIRIRTKKHMALLVYLAIESRRPHRRDDLAEFLWPRAKIDEARHSLSTALSLFRSRLGRDALECSREKIALKQGCLALDLDRLLAGDIVGDESTTALEVTAFLDGFDIPDAPEFTLWKDGQQARLLPAIKQTLLSFMERCHRVGNFHRIEELADRMLALDDLSEEAIRAKMEARALSGDRITALRVFEEWRTKLAAELGAVPSELLEGMAARLRVRKWKRLADEESPSVPIDQWRNRPFVNRSTEYQILHEAWERTRQGLAGHLLVLGDSGVGKTTLVERFITTAALEGAVVSRVQCYDIERDIPYSAISSSINELLDHPGVSTVSPETLAELSRLVPDIRRRFPSVPPSIESHGETARIRTTEAVLELLFAIADEHPVLLIIDDFHFADDASLAVLHLVMRRACRRPIMLMFITRHGELPQSPQAKRLRESVATLGVYEMDIQPLAEKDSRALIAQLVPAKRLQYDISGQRAVLQAAAGYPLAIELLVQDWESSGEKCLAISMDAMTENLLSGRRVTIEYTQLLKRITSSLTPAARNVLNLAAILGHRLNDLDLYTMVDLGSNETISGMTELANRRVLRDSGEKLEFANELIRTAAYLDVPSPVRRHLHSRVADRFCYQENTTGVQLGLEIAWHRIRAGRQHEAAPHLLRGARDAIRRGAPHAAERALTSALPGLQAAERQDAQLLLVIALQEQSRWQESLGVLNQLSSTLESQSKDLAFVLETTARRRSKQHKEEELTGIINQLIQFVNTSSDDRTLTNAAVEAASILEIIRSSQLAGQLLKAISARSEVNLEPEDRARLLLARAMAHYRVEDYEECICDITSGIDVLGKAGIVNSILATLQTGLGAVLMFQGRYTEALKCLREAWETAKRIGNDWTNSTITANLALTHCRLGNYEAALSFSEESAKNNEISPPAASQAAVIAHAMLGHTNKVNDLVPLYATALRTHRPNGFWQAWDLYSADSYLILGRTQDAEETARRALALSTDGPILSFYIGPYARWRARLGYIDGKVFPTLDVLHNLSKGFAECHALDQVEIIVGLAWLEHKATGRVQEERTRVVQERLDSLPAGVTQQLRQMGMLDWL
jgi:DNA-binding SARP family transcriptional activator/tetratricopeptide (TPR) repeat protein